MNSDPQSSVVIYRPDRKHIQMTSLCIQALQIHNLAELQIVHGSRNCNFKVLEKSGIPICVFSLTCWHQFFCMKITKSHA